MGKEKKFWKKDLEAMLLPDIIFNLHEIFLANWCTFKSLSTFSNKYCLLERLGRPRRVSRRSYQPFLSHLFIRHGEKEIVEGILL